MLPTGTALGPYQIIAPLGAGGMGEVYRARDTRLGRDVALKVIAGDLARDRDRIRRFEQEARAAGALNHPNVCAIHDIGTHEGSPFVVMELLEGESLRARLKRGPIPARKAIDYAAQAAHGLAAAHERGIVHRDLKPDNLFLTNDGRVKVLDFGLAKLTRPDLLAPAGEEAATMTATGTGVAFGTMGYMAPEQVRCTPADHRADLFAMGAIVYELLTGRRAFPGDTFYDTGHRILHEDPPPLSVPGKEIPANVEAIVRRCLEKSPQERFQSAGDLAFHFESCLGSGQSIPVKAGRRRPSSRWLVVGVLSLVILAAGAGYRLRPSMPAAPTFQKLSFGKGAVGSARFTPDGNSVIYSARWGDCESELFSTRIDAPGVTSLGLRNVSVVGIRGGEVAILLQSPQPLRESGGNIATLATMPISGGTPRPVLEGVLAADWSPDGKSFAVVRAADGQERVEYPVGNVLFKTSGWIRGIRISQEGDRVAFAHWPHQGGTGGSIMTADRSGRTTTLADRPGVGRATVATAFWSPDGSEIWFTGGDIWGWKSLRAVSFDGKVRTILNSTTSLDLMDVRRDGRVLLLSGTVTSEIWGCALGDSAEQSYSWLDGSMTCDLSADGTMLLFGECSAGGSVGTSMLLRRLDGSLPMRMNARLGLNEMSSDGAWVLAWEESTATLIPTGVGERRTLPRGPMDRPQSAGFFHDGKRILLGGSVADRPPRLYVQDLAGGPPRPISPEGIWFEGSGQCISPDDTRVVARSNGGPVIIPVAGGEPQPIHGLLPGQMPVAWTRDGKSLFVVVSRVGSVMRVMRFELATGKSVLWKEIRLSDPTGAHFTYGPLIVRDGEVYFYSVYRGLNNLFLVEGLR